MSGYITFYKGKKEEFDEKLIKDLKIKRDLLYEVLYIGGAEFNQTREETHALGKNLLSLIQGLRVFGDIVLRGPVVIVGENQ